MEFVGTSGNDILTGTSGNDTIDGGVGSDQLFGGAGDDLIRGGANRDLIRGGGNTLDTLIAEGGRDSLEGGEGNDAYFVSATSSGGTVILDQQGDGNAVNIVAENTDLNTIFSFVNFPPEELTETFAEPEIWGDELDNFSFEGEAFSAYGTEVEGAIPIYRLFDTAGGTHLYTPSANERDTIEDTLPNYESEGIAYYALPRDDATDI